MRAIAIDVEADVDGDAADDDDDGDDDDDDDRGRESFGNAPQRSCFFSGILSLRATTTKMMVMKFSSYNAGFKLSLENVTVLQVRILPTKNQRSQGGLEEDK